MASIPTNLTYSFLLHLLLLAITSQHPTTPPNPDNFYTSFTHCLTLHTPSSTNLSHLLHTPSSPTFTPLLHSSIKNLLFSTPTTRLPSLILSPSAASHVQASVLCCRSHNLPLRTRSAGHDYEGLSYRSLSPRPFAILDLTYLRSISIDADSRTAHVQAGATVGELYYSISAASDTLAFPAGICPTVGVGGHFSGGGFGTMLRAHGLASDNIVGATLVDADGRLLDRESMGEDLFWAIRGGGAASFGVVVSWTLSLVDVPAAVTVFTLHRTDMELVVRWQHVAHRLDNNLFLRVVILAQDSMQVEARFDCLYLGASGELLRLIAEGFPELRLEATDCIEMSWARSVMYFADYRDNKSMNALLDRGSPERYFRAKSDYVTEPIPGFVWQLIWPRFLEDGAGVLIMDPYGGAMSRIAASATPFPHRRGVLYNMQYFVEWRESGEVEKREGWIRRLYGDMSGYVSRDPREAYLNYRDLDLGVNEEEEDGESSVTSYEKARGWGVRYFKGNFERLARVKGRVDPDDFFRNEQSVPPLVIQDLGMGVRNGSYVI